MSVRPHKISITNPFDDTIFAIRATINGSEVSAFKISKIQEILDEFEKVMKKREELKVSGLQGFPRGDEDGPNLR